MHAVYSATLLTYQSLVMPAIGMVALLITPLGCRFLDNIELYAAVLVYWLVTLLGCTVIM